MPTGSASAASGQIRLILTGDVMSGRGVDQLFATRNDARLHEAFVHDARRYVALAERASGPIPAPVSADYVWGDALAVLRDGTVHARIVNLETSVTTAENYWPGKGIHYRMHPDNVACLAAARLDCCVLANNHSLDWGYAGLEETLAVLQRAGLRTAGAGADLCAARTPATLPLPGGRRILVFAYGLPDSGIPAAWSARANAPGLSVLPDLSSQSAGQVAADIARHRRPGDIAVVSLHWGGNWGYGIPGAQRRFARWLTDEGGADVIHGHSSHHPRGIEVRRGKPILYGCGDLLNDYEGIPGHEAYRGDLSLLYMLGLDAGSGRLSECRLIPLQIHRLRLQRATPADARWLADVLSRLGSDFGSSAAVCGPAAELLLTWPAR